jgi:hypothetical protein
LGDNYGYCRLFFGGAYSGREEMKKLLWGLGKWGLLIICLALASCATSQKEWKCYADVNKDSNCVVVDCSKVGEICKTGKYRIIRIFPTAKAYVYSVDPPTDMDKCLDSAKK